uniref:Oxysterol-binding protein n=2 Tax=Esox lucius TaxID=8010 RepID=A0A3P9AK00_ESOLU
MGINSLKSHMCWASHKAASSRRERQLSIASFCGNRVAPPQPSANAVTPPAVAPEATATTRAVSASSSSAADIRVALGGTATLRAEVLWCLHTAEKHHSLNSNENLAEVFKAMFPDSDIAKLFTCGKDKTGYIIRFGLAPHFKQELINTINKAGQFVLMFDESLNQSTKTKQLHVHIRFWEDDRVQSRYLGSQFLGHAVDLLHHIKGPKGENVGSITQPLPSNYLIFRAASESDGRCWMDALELALSCSSLYKLTAKTGKDGDISSSSESSHILQLLQSTALTDTELLHLANQHMENDGYSEKSEHDAQEDWDNGANENGGRLTEESDMDQSDELSPGLQATAYVEQCQEEIGEAGEASQVETVSEENKGLIWTLLKQLRPGMDLSKVVLPTFILEPRSFLDKLSDYYYHANLLSEAAREESAYGRIKQVVRWYLSGFYKKPKGLKKPYNPILGETFRCCWLHPQTDSCTFYIAEQISHHPPISAFYVCNKKDGFCISGSILAKSKFYGNSLSAILDGRARLMLLGRDEEYVITMPYAHCKGILYGTMTLELGGKITIECDNTKYLAELEFKLKPFLGGPSSVNVISGKIQHGDDVLATLDGHWDGEVFLQEKKSGQQEILWNPTPEVRKTRLRRQVVRLDQQGQFESERLWQDVTGAILDRDQNRATQEKFVLEEAQRNEAKERGDKPWIPRLFNLDPVTNEWTYTHIDTRPWDPEHCLVQFEKHGVIQTKERTQGKHKGLPYSRAAAWASQQKAQVNGKHRKGSSQPSSCSQNTESSSTTPEPTHESSDNEGYLAQCARCNKEVKDIALIEASITSLQKTQQDIQRNLTALDRQLGRHRETADNAKLTGRHCLILCVLLLSQLFLNYIFT